MDKSLVVGAVLGSLFAAGSGATMQYAAQREPLSAPKPALIEQRSTLEESGTVPVATKIAPKPAAMQRTAPEPSPPSFARVIDVQPIQRTLETPRQQCREVVVSPPQPTWDSQRIAGTIGGALVGGLLGHQVGDGRGKDLATVAGAAAGAFGGRQVQKEIQRNRMPNTTEQRCETVMDTRVETDGYQVRYEIDGQTATVRMGYDPGKRIPLSHGQLVI